MSFVDNSVLLNKIRETASNAYQAEIPVATAANITDVAEAVLTAPGTVQNEFASAMINLIGKVVFDSVQFENPFTSFKKGKLPFGSTIEHVYFDMLDAIKYTAGTRSDDVGPPDQFEIFKSKVHAAFYSAVLEAQYPLTISHDDLKRALYGEGGLSSFIANQAQALRATEQYDEYRMTVALLARQIEAAKTGAEDTPATNEWNGYIPVLTNYNTEFTQTLDAADALKDKDFLVYLSNTIKKWSKRMTFPRSDLNIAGVKNAVPKSKQALFTIADLSADFESYLLPWAYNSDMLKLNIVKEIDAWYTIGADDTSPTPTVAPDNILIKSGVTGDNSAPVVATLFHEDMCQIYNQKDITEEARNARGHYTNSFHTIGDIYAASPFHNFVAFALE